MYSRTIDGLEMTFGVSGKLWHGVLVMFDRETESLWTQLDGRAIRGEEMGRKLAHVPSVFTTWEAWVGAHPDTLVLEKDPDAQAMKGSHYAEYFADPDRTFMPHLAVGLGEGVGPKVVVFGIRGQKEALAVSEEQLERDGVVQAWLEGVPVAWLRNPATGDVRAVRRDPEGVALDLAAIDDVDPTTRVRDLTTGGEVEVDSLEAQRVDRAFWYAWARTVDGARFLAD